MSPCSNMDKHWSQKILMSGCKKFINAFSSGVNFWVKGTYLKGKNTLLEGVSIKNFIIEGSSQKFDFFLPKNRQNFQYYYWTVILIIDLIWKIKEKFAKYKKNQNRKI